MTPSSDTLELLLDYEVGGGEKYYNDHLKSPTYPGEASGVTIGVGYDLGYNSLSQFKADWKARLSPDDFTALAACLGKTGPGARSAIPGVKSIQISWDDASAVFANSTIPRFWKQTLEAFPEAEGLPSDCQGALLSLVFNRGPKIDDSDRRREMLHIRTALKNGQPEKVPNLIRAMIRIWVGGKIEKGMRLRRSAEATLFEKGLAARTGSDIRVGGEKIVALPDLKNTLKLGSSGEQVVALQKALNSLGYNCGPADGDFGARTDAAVRAFQRIAGLTADGVVGPLTWKELGGKVEAPVAADRTGEEKKREKLAAFAETEAAKNYVWSASSPAETKILSLLRGPMQQIGHIGKTIVLYDWCAAFVYYCAKDVGYVIPTRPSNFGATMALVESWKAWGLSEGIWHPRGTITPQRGDIVCFEWKDHDTDLDHIGVVRSYTPGSTTIETAEGNVGNMSKNKTRELANCAGFIRLR
jgi:GH24 family phage-related lysozyme (muramidase)